MDGQESHPRGAGRDWNRRLVECERSVAALARSRRLGPRSAGCCRSRTLEGTVQRMPSRVRSRVASFREERFVRRTCRACGATAGAEERSTERSVGVQADRQAGTPSGFLRQDPWLGGLRHRRAAGGAAVCQRDDVPDARRQGRAFRGYSSAVFARCSQGARARRLRWGPGEFRRRFGRSGGHRRYPLPCHACAQKGYGGMGPWSCRRFVQPGCARRADTYAGQPQWQGTLPARGRGDRAEVRRQNYHRRVPRTVSGSRHDGADELHRSIQGRRRQRVDRNPISNASREAP